MPPVRRRRRKQKIGIDLEPTYSINMTKTRSHPLNRRGQAGRQAASKAEAKAKQEAKAKACKERAKVARKARQEATLWSTATREQILAACEYHLLQTRTWHPEGEFDDAKRFYLDAKAAGCPCCQQINEPTRRFPNSENAHGRTAEHVACERGVDVLAVRRLRKAIKVLVETTHLDKHDIASVHRRCSSDTSLDPYKALMVEANTAPPTIPYYM